MLRNIFCGGLTHASLRVQGRYFKWNTIVSEGYVVVRPLSSYEEAKDHVTPSIHEKNISKYEPDGLLQGRYNGRRWSTSEDEKLRKAVEKLGHNWAGVATLVGNRRTNRGCRQRWIMSLKDNINRQPFTSDEISKLMKLKCSYPGQWGKIARKLGTNRTPNQVFEIARNRLNATLSIHRWSPEEDRLLRAAIARFGVGKWASVATMVSGRSDAQCYGRWTFSLAPTLVFGEWSKSEDERLLSIVQGLKQSGKAFHFGHVAELMDNTRSRKSCRARFLRLVRQGKAIKI